jgi:cation transport ATPase
VAYTTTMWLSFGEALAAISGALTGLLFVAVSVKGNVLTESRPLSSRAAQTLVLFMTSVLIAVFLVTPQPTATLGWELLTLSAASGAVLLTLDWRAGHSAEHGAARYVERFSPNMITAVLVGVAGATFLAKAGGGLYWLIPAVLTSLVGGVINAWLFLIKVPS